MKKLKSSVYRLASRLRMRTWVAFALIIIMLPIALFALFRANDTSATWFDEAWQFRKQITIDADQVSGSTDLTNFPVLISVTDTDVAASAQTDGDDIVFTDINGIRLNHEIANYSYSSGELEAWVKVPTVYAATDTILYMYYGNATATNSEKPTAVWQESSGVWHMDEDSSGVSAVNRSDFAPYGNHLTDNNTTPSLTGQIHRALSTNGSSQYLSITDANENGLSFGASYTLSAWVSMDSDAVAQGLVSRSDGNSDNDMELSWKDQGGGTYGFVLTHSASGGGTSTSNSTYTAASYTNDTLIYVSAVYDDANDQLRWYINGSASGSTSSFTNHLTATTNPFWVGRVNSSYWDGRIDEVRYTPSVRSSDWIATEYANQNAPGTFMSFGSQEKTDGPVAIWDMDQGTDNTCPVTNANNDSTVRQVLNGSTSIGASTNSTTVNLSPALLDKNKSFMTFSVQVNEADPDCGQVVGEITNTTTLTFMRESDSCSNSITIEYYVAEFTSGVSVQHGKDTSGSLGSTNNFTIDEVDTTKAFPIINTQNGFSSFNEDDWAEAEITSSTNLQVRLEGTTTHTFLYYQIVEYEDAAVQHGSVSMPTSTGSVTDTLDTAVDTSKAWLMFTYRQDGDNTAIGNFMLRGRLTNSTTVAFDRDASTYGNINITWYVIEFNNDTSVQHNTVNFGTSDTQKDVTISAVDRTKSIATAGGLYYRGGKTSYTGDDNPGTSSMTLDMTSDTNLRLTRALTGSSTSDVGWFVIDFDDTPGIGNANDVCDSASGYHGERNGTTWRQAEMCVSGKCIGFDGTDDTVDVLNRTNLGFERTDSLSISAWIRTGSEGTMSIISKQDSASPNAGWNLFTGSSGQIHFNLTNTVSTNVLEVRTNDTDYNDNRWHHVEVTYDGTSAPGGVTIYFDGESEPLTTVSNTLNASIDNSINVYIGSRNGTDQFFNGTIDQVKVFPYERTSSQALVDFNQYSTNISTGNQAGLSDGLVGYWKLDEDSGDAVDSSGNGYNLTNNGTTTFVAAKYNFGSEHVPASSQYFSTASTVNSVSTISFWVNPDSTTNNYFNLTSTQYVTSSSGTLAATGFTGTFYVNGEPSTTITADTWQHVVVVLSSPIDADTFYLGRANSGYFDGTMDEFRLYSRALSGNEIKALYMYAPGPDGYWNFNEGTGSTAHDISGNANHASLEEITASVAAVTLEGTVTGTASTGANSITLTSWTPNANDLILIAMNTRDNVTISSISGNNLTFEQIDAVDQGTVYAEMWRAMGSSPTTGSITINLSGTLATDMGAVASASRFSNADISGTNGSGAIEASASAYSLSDDTTPTVDITTASGNSVVYGAIGSRNRTITEGSGYTKITDNLQAGSGGNVAGMLTEYKTVATPSTVAVDGTLSSAHDWIVIAAAIKANVPVGASGWLPGVFGWSRTLDGLDDIGKISDNSELDFGAGESMSLEAWFKHPTQESGSDTLINKFESTGADGGYRISINSNGEIVCGIDDENTSFPEDSVTSTGSSYDDNEWHHVACVKDGNTSLKLYVDGILKATDSTISATGTLANDDPLYFGIEGDEASNLWLGQIDEVKLYHYPRSVEQVRQDMAGAIVGGGIGDPLPQPVTHWGFDEQSGQIAHSRMASGLDGTLGSTSSSESSDPTWKTKTNCKINGCLSFDGGDSVNMNNPASLSFERTDAFSISAWFKTSTDSSMSIVTKQSSSSPYTGYNLQTGIDGYIFFQLINNYGTNSFEIRTTNNTNYSDGNWHHVVTTYDGSSSASGIRIYLDGISQSLTTIQDSLSSSIVTSTPLQVGSRNNAAQFFNGSIDEVKIYNSALSAYQAKLDYNTASALAISATGDEYKDVGDGTGNPPVAYFAMDENQGLTRTVDKSGNNYEGTISSISNGGWTPGKYGSAIKLNGSDDYIDIGTGPSSVKTVTFWVKPTTTTEYFVNLTGTSDYIWANGGTVTATGFSTPTIYVNGIATTTISAGSWQHVAVVTDTAENASNFDIGRTADTNYLEGTIDEVKLYDYALTQAQVAYDYNRGAPIAYYRFDECQGTEIHDASGGGNDGTLTVTTTGGNTSGVGNCETATSAWGTGAIGKYSASINFDGDGDYVDIGDTGRTDAYAVSFWAKPADTTESFMQLSASDTVAVSSGSISVGGFGTETVYVDGVQTTSFSDNSWHHVTVVSNSAITANDMDIGRISTTYFNGQIDDVQIFNYVLSANQIRKLYNASSAVRFE